MALEVSLYYLSFFKAFSFGLALDEKRKKLTSFSSLSLFQKKKNKKNSQEKFEVTLDEEGAEGIATVSDAADLILSKLG